jgi:hypothetical protein
MWIRERTESLVRGRTELVETDGWGRTVLTGCPDQQSVVHASADASLLLQPILAAADAQAEFESDPELLDLLACTARSASIRRSRSHR